MSGRTESLFQIPGSYNQLLNPFSGRRRDGIYRSFRFKSLAKALHRILLCFRIDGIRLVGRNDLRNLEQRHAVLPKFPVNGFHVLYRIPAFGTGCVHHMDQQPCPLDMTQEIVPKSDAFRGTIDQARNIRHDESLTLPQVYHAQIGL